MKNTLMLFSAGVLFFLLSFTICFSQSPISQFKGEADVKPAVEGTFQLIQIGKVTEALNSDLLSVIESQRHETETVFYSLSANLLVKILSRNEINRADFVPVKELYANDNNWKGDGK